MHVTKNKYYDGKNLSLRFYSTIEHPLYAGGDERLAAIDNRSSEHLFVGGRRLDRGEVKEFIKYLDHWIVYGTFE